MRLQTFNCREYSSIEGKGWFVHLGTNPRIMKMEGLDLAGLPKLIHSNGDVANSFFVSSTHLRSPEIGFSAIQVILVDDCVDDMGNVIHSTKLARLCKEHFPKSSAKSAKYWKAYNRNFNA